MKCAKCGQSYKGGSHFCAYCGAMTAEGELSLALTDFAKATKHLAKETARIGKTSLQEIKPDFDKAMQTFTKAADQFSLVAKPTARKAMVAATAPLQLAAQAANSAAAEIHKASKGR